MFSTFFEVDSIPFKAGDQHVNVKQKPGRIFIFSDKQIIFVFVCIRIRWITSSTIYFYPIKEEGFIYLWVFKFRDWKWKSYTYLNESISLLVRNWNHFIKGNWLYVSFLLEMGDTPPLVVRMFYSNLFFSLKSQALWHQSETSILKWLIDS